MNAELIVINGPLAGSRHPLGQDEVLIGRAPNSKLVMSEPDVGWRHCQIRRQGSRFLSDRPSDVTGHLCQWDAFERTVVRRPRPDRNR